jgi:hypothetical protein
MFEMLAKYNFATNTVKPCDAFWPIINTTREKFKNGVEYQVSNIIADVAFIKRVLGCEPWQFATLFCLDLNDDAPAALEKLAVVLDQPVGGAGAVTDVHACGFRYIQRKDDGMPNRNVDQLHSLARLDALHDRSGGKRDTKFSDQFRSGRLADLDMLTTCRATIALSNTRNRKIQVDPISLDFADYVQVKDSAGITSWGAKEAATERVVTGNRSPLEVFGLVGTVDTKNHYVAFSYCSKTHVV